MPRPPFKVDGRHGAVLRYRARDGRMRVTSGRRTFVYGRVFVDALLTGQAAPGEPYEMRVTKDGPWHKLTLTPEEAAAALAADRLARRRLARLARRPDYVGPR